MGLLYKIRVRVVNFLVFFFLIVLLPGLPPKTTFPFEAFSLPPLKELKGGLEPNNHLDNAERLFEGKLYGPEALLVRGKDLYATVHGGEIVRINGPHITHVAKLGKPCEYSFEEQICGRPLGLAFDTQSDSLVVADAYYGIWLVELSTGDKKQLVSGDIALDGKNIKRKPHIFNSVAVAKNGDIYWTDSSSDVDLHDGLYTVFANPSGRLFHYDRKTRRNTALLDKLYFANGVVLSPQEDFVLVAETMSSVIRRVYLKGPKAGTDDVFVDGIPGALDNLIADEEGLWAPLVMAADEENPSIGHLMCKVPLIRKFLARLLYLAEMPFRILHQVWPSVHSQRILHAIGHFEMVSFMNADRVTVVRLDWQGNIVGSLHGFDRSLASISHVVELGDYLYLGSPYNKYLARVKMPKIKVPKVRIQNVHFEPEPVPTVTTTTSTTPKPTTTTTTTTPKPVTTTTTTTTTPKPPSTTTTSTTTTTTPKPTPKATPTPQQPKPTKPPTVTEAPVKKQEKPEKPTKPPTATPAPEKKPEPAPIHEKIPDDIPKPKQEKLKVIKRGGEQGEL
ncbi:adipocyte plasma membrane-associated protein Hemomucin [Malaya genurostris]|uniref:adipocyte plasma membrane-associated protein Hemomucin n=1 Tax=Malaya genurostris TaxID=325434 RepID=UPI0026F3CC22|nr:adipocyte plasma membrane-associated protein Hemomucin [Malaya genurostris]